MATKQPASSGSALIIEALNPIIECNKTNGEAINAVKLAVDNLTSTFQTDKTLMQAQFEEIKATLDLILKAQSGAKKQVKPAEDKEPAPMNTTATTTTTTTTAGTAKAKVETEIQFFQRMAKDNAEFKAKYSSDAIIAKCTEKNKKCKGHHVITTMPEFAKLKEEFLAEYNNSKNKPVETKAVEVKDDI
jgi:hypothetical protein